MFRLFIFAFLVSTVTAEPLVTIETVHVGDPGNAPDGVNGYGAVRYEFRMGRYEVTIGQYAAFLNAVAQTNTNEHILNLWNPSMSSDATMAGISRSGSGTASDPFVYSPMGPIGIAPVGASSVENRPIAYVGWTSAARFCNWLHNGATNGADTESGAYSLNGAPTGFFTRNRAAKWWIPNENEWYKSAYYKGGGTNAGYWLYPTQSDQVPGNSLAPAPNQANLVVGTRGLLCVTQSTDRSSDQNYLTDAGAFTQSPSPFGTFDQCGNLNELLESLISSGTNTFYNVRGGDWTWEGGGSAKARPSRTPSNTRWPQGDKLTGFRVASSMLADPKESLRVASSSRNVSGFAIAWTPRISVDVQRRASLSAGQWETVSSNNSSGSYFDTQAPSDSAFYRVVAP
jgi:sulfatase modifying factor 1